MPRKKPPVPSELAAHVKALEAAGAQVSFPKPWMTHTFEVDERTYKAFRLKARQLGFKVKDALDEALTEWVKKTRVSKI